jgi:hypothetical protein
MDTMIYHLIGLTAVSTFLFAMGWLNVIKMASATILLCSPFGFALVFLAQSGVITL